MRNPMSPTRSFAKRLLSPLYVVLEDARGLLPRLRRALSGGNVPDSASS